MEVRQTPPMSQLPPPSPYGGQRPYEGYPTPPASPPRRKRPRTIWFFVGGALLVLAPVVFVGALFTVLRPLTQQDAVFSASGSPVQLELPAGQERALFTDSGVSAGCSAVDGTGSPVELRPVTGDFTYNQWTAVSRFDTGDGEVTFTCADAGAQLRIAQLPSTGGFVAGVVIGVVAPLVLGGTGLLVLLITTILYVTGAPRRGADLPDVRT